MLILLSPAKKIDETGQTPNNCSMPTFIKEAEQLIKNLRKYKPAQLSELMSISPTLANLNCERYAKWNSNHSIADSKAAVLAFNGEVYSGLDAGSFSEEEMEVVQNHLRILSGLYGVLKPYDLINSYRLEMGTKLKIGAKNNLYEFWGDKIVNKINEVLSSQKERIIINLASNEYFKSINKKKLEATIVTPVFKDFNNGKYKMVMVYTKKARGMMANYIIKNKIKKINDLIGFNTSGYCYNEAASTEKELVFYRG